MAFRDIKTLQYDATMLSSVTEEYIKAMMNVGLRYGEKGQGIEFRKISIREIVNQILYSDNSWQGKAKIDVTLNLKYIEIFKDDNSSYDENIDNIYKCHLYTENGLHDNILTLSKNIKIGTYLSTYEDEVLNICDPTIYIDDNNEINIMFTTDKVFKIGGKNTMKLFTELNKNTLYHYIISKDRFYFSGYVNQIDDNRDIYTNYKFEIFKDKTDVDLLKITDYIHNNKEYIYKVIYSTYENTLYVPVMDYLYDEPDDSIQQLVNTINKIYSNIVLNIVKTYNNNFILYQGSNLLAMIFDSIKSILFADYQQIFKEYTLFVDPDYEFYLEYNVNTTEDSEEKILYNAGEIKVAVKKFEEYDNRLFNEDIYDEILKNHLVCNFDYSAGKDKYFDYITKKEQFVTRFINIITVTNPIELNNVKINHLIVKIGWYDVFIGANDNWYINNSDTGICAKGKNAGLPNLVILKTYVNNGDVESEFLGGASNLEKDLKDIISYQNILDYDFEELNLKFVELYDGYSSMNYKYDTTDYNTILKEFVYLLPSTDESLYSNVNQLTSMRNMLVMNISNVIRDTDEYNNYIYTQSDIKHHVTFWVYNSNEAVNDFECIMDSESYYPYDLNQLVCVDEIIKYVIDIIENGKPLDNKLNKFEHSILRFKPKLINSKLDESTNIYQFIKHDDISNELSLKIFAADYKTSGGIPRFKDNNGYFLDINTNGEYIQTICPTPEKLNNYRVNQSIIDYNILNSVPTLDFSEILINNETAINRINLMLFGKPEFSPYSAYIGLNQLNRTFDNALHIGSSNTNNNLGNIKLASLNFINSLNVLTDLTSDFTYNNFKHILTDNIISSYTIDKNNHKAIIDSHGVAYFKNFISYQFPDSINNYILNFPSSLSLFDRLYVTTFNDADIESLSNKKLADKIANTPRGTAVIDNVYAKYIEVGALKVTGGDVEAKFDILPGSTLSLKTGSDTSDIQFINSNGDLKGYIKSSSEAKFVSVDANNGQFRNIVANNANITDKLNFNKANGKYLYAEHIESEINNIGWLKFKNTSLGNDDSKQLALNSNCDIYNKIVNPIGLVKDIYCYDTQDFVTGLNVKAIGFDENRAGNGPKYTPTSYKDDTLFVTIHYLENKQDKGSVEKSETFLNIKKLIQQYWLNVIEGPISEHTIFILNDVTIMVDDVKNTNSKIKCDVANGFIQSTIGQSIYDTDLTTGSSWQRVLSDATVGFSNYPYLKLSEPLKLKNHIICDGVIGYKSLMVSSPLSLTLVNLGKTNYLKIEELSPCNKEFKELIEELVNVLTNKINSEINGLKKIISSLLGDIGYLNSNVNPIAYVQYDSNVKYPDTEIFLKDLNGDDEFYIKLRSDVSKTDNKKYVGWMVNGSHIGTTDDTFTIKFIRTDVIAGYGAYDTKTKIYTYYYCDYNNRIILTSEFNNTPAITIKYFVDSTSTSYELATVYVGKSMALASGPQLENAVFDGWYTNSSYNGTRYKQSESYVISDEFTNYINSDNVLNLYGRMNKNTYSIKLWYKGLNYKTKTVGPSDSYNLVLNMDRNSPSTDWPNKGLTIAENIQFVNWYLDPQCTIEIQYDSFVGELYSYTINSDMNMYFGYYNEVVVEIPGDIPSGDYEPDLDPDPGEKPKPDPEPEPIVPDPEPETDVVVTYGFSYMIDTHNDIDYTFDSDDDYHRSMITPYFLFNNPYSANVVNNCNCALLTSKSYEWMKLVYDDWPHNIDNDYPNLNFLSDIPMSDSNGGAIGDVVLSDGLSGVFLKKLKLYDFAGKYLLKDAQRLYLPKLYDENRNFKFLYWLRPAPLGATSNSKNLYDATNCYIDESCNYETTQRRIVPVWTHAYQLNSSNVKLSCDTGCEFKNIYIEIDKNCVAKDYQRYLIDNPKELTIDKDYLDCIEILDTYGNTLCVVKNNYSIDNTIPYKVDGNNLSGEYLCRVYFVNERSIFEFEENNKHWLVEKQNTTKLNNSTNYLMATININNNTPDVFNCDLSITDNIIATSKKTGISYNNYNGHDYNDFVEINFEYNSGSIKIPMIKDKTLYYGLKVYIHSYVQKTINYTDFATNEVRTILIQEKYEYPNQFSLICEVLKSQVFNNNNGYATNLDPIAEIFFSNNNMKFEFDISDENGNNIITDPLIDQDVKFYSSTNNSVIKTIGISVCYKK